MILVLDEKTILRATRCYHEDAEGNCTLDNDVCLSGIVGGVCSHMWPDYQKYVRNSDNGKD